MDMEDFSDRIFTTALKQRLVKNRVNMTCGINFEMRLRAPGPTEAINWIEEHAVKQRRTIRSLKVHQLLTAVGGYRPHAGEVFPKTHTADGDKCYVKMLAQQCLIDPQFVLEPALGDRQEGSDKLIRMGLEPVSYTELCEVIEILKVWRDPIAGPGRNELFVGTFLEFYPIHNLEELKFLKQEWCACPALPPLSHPLPHPTGESVNTISFRGNFGMMCRGSVESYWEGENGKSFGHPKNELRRRTFPFVWSYQPINEIRDYFGEDAALYYSWLGNYTAGLFICMIFGIVTMCCQPIFGGVEKNPLTLAYSIYIGLWSVSFIETWRRKEVEWRFLWGSEVATAVEELNPRFVGKLIVTETGRERMVQKSNFDQYSKIIISYFAVWLMITATVASALGASLIKNTPTPGEAAYKGPLLAAFEEGGVPGPEGCLEDTKYPFFDHPCGFWEQNYYNLLSSVCNLFIIQSFGFAYEIIAEKLNTYENHRTASEFDNALVVKNFLFQVHDNKLTDRPLLCRPLRTDHCAPTIVRGADSCVCVALLSS